MSTAVAVHEESSTFGVFPGKPFAAYYGLAGVNHSLLERLMRSPAHAREEALHPKDPTAAFATGHAFHVRLLEPERYALEYVAPPKVDRRTKAGRATWAEWEMDNPGKFLLKADEAELYERMAEAVLAHPIASQLVCGRGVSELSLVWPDEETGLVCKGRLDRLAGLEGWPFVVDVKTTRDAAPRAFRRDVANYGYHRQLAFYRQGLDVLRSAPRRAAIVAVEKEPPFAVACYELAERALEQGERENAEALVRYRECLDTGKWPGYGEGLELLDLPAWAVDRLD